MSKLQQLRKEKGLTQADLAQSLGLAVETISRWERGVHEPRLYLPQLLALCKKLGCKPKDLEEMP